MHYFCDYGDSFVLKYPIQRGRLSACMAVYTPVFGSGILLRLYALAGTIPCVHAVVRAVLPCPHKNITIFRSALVWTSPFEKAC